MNKVSQFGAPYFFKADLYFIMRIISSKMCTFAKKNFG